jgi:hypothetical protein
MSSPTEQQLRELFAADAAGAPSAGDLAALALHRVRQRRRVRRTVASGLIAALVVVGGSAVVWGPLGSASSPAAAPTGVGALPGDATGDCTGYTLDRFTERLTEPGFFALDGTVTAVEPGADLSPEMPTQYSTVTFRVGTWFHGGSGDTVEVFLDPPGSEDSDVRSYGVGTRLLVSGVLGDTARPSGTMTATEDMGFFGFSCGYSRYYDEQTAADWAAATD